MSDLRMNLELIRLEAAREMDPIFAARVRRLLENVLLRHDKT